MSEPLREGASPRCIGCGHEVHEPGRCAAFMEYESVRLGRMAVPCWCGAANAERQHCRECGEPVSASDIYMSAPGVWVHWRCMPGNGVTSFGRVRSADIATALVVSASVAEKADVSEARREIRERRREAGLEAPPSVALHYLRRLASLPVADLELDLVRAEERGGYYSAKRRTPEEILRDAARLYELRASRAEYAAEPVGREAPEPPRTVPRRGEDADPAGGGQS